MTRNEKWWAWVLILPSDTFKWLNTYIASLLWSLRTNQRWYSTQNWAHPSAMIRNKCTTEYRSTVSAGVLLILILLTRSSKEFKEKSGRSKTFGSFSNKLSLDLGISSCFPSLISSFQRATVRYKQFPSPLTTTSLLRVGIISDVVICLFNSLTRIKIICIYINTTEKT